MTFVEPPKPGAPEVLVTAEPVNAFADAGAIQEDKTALQQAQEYHDRGQNWLARLLLEKRALSPEGTPQEVQLLASICEAQKDAACIDACGKKLGKKIKWDAGGAVPPGSPERPAATDFTKARDLHLKHMDREARALLEPRVIDGKAPPEEVRLLLEICSAQKDRMCMALCKKQLGQ